MRVFLALLALALPASVAAQAPAVPADTVWAAPGTASASLALSPDGTLLAVGGTVGATEDGFVTLRTAGTGAVVADVRGTVAATAGLSFTLGGTRLVSTHATVSCAPNGGCSPSDQQIIAWTVPTLSVATSRSFGSIVPTGVATSPDGAQVAVGFTFDNAGAIRLLDGATLTSQMLLDGHTARTSTVAFSPDGTRLASAGDDAVVRVWDTATGALVRTLALRDAQSQTVAPLSLAFSPDGQTLVAGTFGALPAVFAWRVADGVRLYRLDARIVETDLWGGTVRVRVSPNGAYAVAAVAQGIGATSAEAETVTRLRVYDLATGALAADYDTGRWPGFATGFGDVALSPGQNNLVAYTLRGSVVAVRTPLSLADPLTTAGEPGAGAGAALSLAGPNPFRTSTALALRLPEAGPVRVDLLDALGRRVAVLLDGTVAPGVHTLPVEASRLPAGVYTVRARVGTAVLSRSLTVVR